MTSNAPRSRSPNGVLTKQPIQVRLLPAERAHVVGLAKASNCTLAAMIRRLALIGLQQSGQVGAADVSHGE